jgi:quinoprotein glucose dehydrogenase
VALNVRTGALIWQFQTVHHNLFDYDPPAQPTLIEVNRNGQNFEAVAQPTKTGFLWVLNRESGQPLFPVVERAVPQSDVPGESILCALRLKRADEQAGKGDGSR